MAQTEAARRAFISDGEYEKVRGLLQLSDADIDGKRILDIGSGRMRLFSKELEKRFPNTTVVNLDYSFKRPLAAREKGIPRFSIFGYDFFIRQERNYNVAGLFTQLPFQDATFDLVISNDALTRYIPDRESQEQAFAEIVRVVKPGGKAHLQPVWIFKADGNLEFEGNPKSLSVASSGLVRAEVKRAPQSNCTTLILTK